jgi:hypothetical protein
VAVAEVWARTDAKAAAEAFAQAAESARAVTRAVDRPWALVAVARAWAKTDPKHADQLFEDAEKAAGDIPEPVRKSKALLAIAEGRVRTDAKAVTEVLQSATKVAATHPDVKTRAKLYAWIAAGFGRAGSLPEAEESLRKAVRASVAFSETDERARILLRVSTVLAQLHSWHTAFETTSEIPVEGERMRALAAILWAWSKRQEPIHVDWDILDRPGGSRQFVDDPR